MEKTAIAYLSRIEKFSSAHRLHSCKLSDEENVKLYGKCNNLKGHGHNYKLITTVKGPIDKRNGMIMNITDLKKIIEDNVLRLLDHKHLDEDVEYFRNHRLASTAENIVVFVWTQLDGKLPSGVSLHEIKLYETDKNVAQFNGEFIATSNSSS